jgi:hypothetical protein
MTETFRAALNHFRRVSGPRPALMCAEREWTDCHRQIIAGYLTVSGHQVIHLIDGTSRENGRLPPSGGRKDLLSGFAWAASIRTVNASALKQQFCTSNRRSAMPGRTRSLRLQETVSSVKPQLLFGSQRKSRTASNRRRREYKKC